MVEVVAELGELAGGEHDLLAHHGGEIEFGVAGVGVLGEEVVDEGAVEPGAEALEEIHAGAGHGGRAFEIEEAERLADLPMRLGREGKRLAGRRPVAG